MKFSDLSRVKVGAAVSVTTGALANAWGAMSPLEFAALVAVAGGAVALRHKMVKKRLFGGDKKVMGLEQAIVAGLAERDDAAPVVDRPVRRAPVVDTSGGILLGLDRETGEDYFWTPDDLPNRNIIIFGESGNGKTYTQLKLMIGIKQKYGHAGILLDIKPSFSDSDIESEPDFLDKLGVDQHYIALNPLAVNVFKPMEKTLGLGERKRFVKESNGKVATRVAGIFAEVYGMSPDQFSTLKQCIKDGLDTVGAQFTLANMLERLGQLDEEDNEVYQFASFIRNKIEPFVTAGQDDDGLFDNGDLDWGELFQHENLQVIQYDWLSSETIKRVTSEFILRSLLTYIKQNGYKEATLPLYIPECHNLSFESGSPLPTLLKEIRSKGGVLILDTQGAASLGEKAANKIDEGCSTTMYFKPTDNDVIRFSIALAKADPSKTKREWGVILSGLKLGECVIRSGTAVNVVKIAKI